MWQRYPLKSPDRSQHLFRIEERINTRKKINITMLSKLKAKNFYKKANYKAQNIASFFNLILFYLVTILPFFNAEYNFFYILVTIHKGCPNSCILN